jgi:hypothetical protein
MRPPKYAIRVVEVFGLVQKKMQGFLVKPAPIGRFLGFNGGEKYPLGMKVAGSDISDPMLKRGKTDFLQIAARLLGGGDHGIAAAVGQQGIIIVLVVTDRLRGVGAIAHLYRNSTAAFQDPEKLTK